MPDRCREDRARIFILMQYRHGKCIEYSVMYKWYVKLYKW